MAQTPSLWCAVCVCVLRVGDSIFHTFCDALLTVHLLSASVCEKHAHHLLEVAAGLRREAVLAHVVQHPLQDVVQGRGRLVQQDAGPGQEAVQVPVRPHLLLKVHQLHILQGREDSVFFYSGMSELITAISVIKTVRLKHIVRMHAAQFLQRRHTPSL